jgi:hypothetical protein
MRVGYNGVNNAPARRLDNLAQNSDVPPDVTVVTDQGQMEGGADRASRSVHQKAVGVEDIEISVASGAVEQGDISADRAVNVKVRDRHMAKLIPLLPSHVWTACKWSWLCALFLRHQGPNDSN